jgi:SAM-dependent methyltransferase
MLVARDDCLNDLRCPRSGRPLRKVDDQVVVCGSMSETIAYPIVDEKPVLVDFSQSILDSSDLLSSHGGSLIRRRKYHGLSRSVRKLAAISDSETARNVNQILTELKKHSSPARILIVGGGTIGRGMQPFYNDSFVQLYSFDIYSSPYVQFIADAHQMPLQESFFDAVIVQAVLEHVLQPSVVVEEIWRVLKHGGLVYAETPFVQQVHEGAYDFTRFTDSGHRYLFRRFDLIRSGPIGGPGAQLTWSIEYLVRSICRSWTAGKIAKAAFYWIKYFDALISPEYAIDSALAVYFLGRKNNNIVTAISMVDYYKGAQKALLKHS